MSIYLQWITRNYILKKRKTYRSFYVLFIYSIFAINKIHILKLFSRSFIPCTPKNSGELSKYQVKIIKKYFKNKVLADRCHTVAQRINLRFKFLTRDTIGVSIEALQRGSDLLNPSRDELCAKTRSRVCSRRISISLESG